jgi:hypothetical protein
VSRGAVWKSPSSCHLDAASHDSSGRKTMTTKAGAMESAPFGSFLLTAVAVGFAAFGLFGLAQSRYRRM